MSRNNVFIKAHNQAYDTLKSQVDNTLERLSIVPADIGRAGACYPQGSDYIIFNFNDSRLNQNSVTTSENFVVFTGGNTGITEEDRIQKLNQFYTSTIMHEYLHSYFTTRHIPKLREVLYGPNPSITTPPQSSSGNNTLDKLIDRSVRNNVKKHGLKSEDLGNDPILVGINEAFAYAVSDALTQTRTLYEHNANSYDALISTGTSKYLKAFYEIFTDAIHYNGIDEFIARLPVVILGSIEYVHHSRQEVHLDSVPETVMNYAKWVRKQDNPENFEAVPVPKDFKLGQKTKNTTKRILEERKNR